MDYSAILYFLAAFLLSLIGCRLAIPLLTRWRVMDEPNARSNHVIPVPRGGGIVVVAVILGVGVFSDSILFESYGFGIVTTLPVLMLSCVSFYDDIRGLSALWRFIAQFFAVGLYFVGVSLFSDLHIERLFWNIGMLVFFLVVTLLWLWFTNLYNFMDGINGITVVETISICIGLFIFKPDPILLVIIGSVLGFYWWNRHPAKLFLGDSGSVPLGFLLFFLMLGWRSESLLLMLLIPLYYWLDATTTLVWRVAKGHKFWQAHSDHAYQWAVRSGLSHNQVVLRIFLLNCVLIGLTYGAIHHSGYAPAYTFAAFCVTTGLIIYFRRRYLHREVNEQQRSVRA